MEDLNASKHLVLIVEDEELLLQAIGKKLTNHGLDIVSCASGKQAIDYLNSIEKLPNAIWLDYYLKDMNGIDFMHYLRRQEKFAKVPIVVVSNSASPDKVHDMLALGVTKYYLKAEKRLDELVDEIKSLIISESKL